MEKKLRDIFAKQRIDRLNENDINDLRDYISKFFEEWEGLRNFDAALNDGYITPSGVLGLSFDRSKRIQALRMFIGFEVEEIAGLLNMTRITYKKYESEGFESGILESDLKQLIERSTKKLYEKAENPKFSRTWKFLIPTITKTKILRCGNNHEFSDDYFICPYCDLLDLEQTEYFEVDEINIKNNLEELNKKIKDFIQTVELGDKKIDRYSHLSSSSYRSSDPIVFFNPPEDIEVIKEMYGRSLIDVDSISKDLRENLSKALFLLDSMYQVALSRELFNMYFENPDKHRATVDEILKNKNLYNSKKYDEIRNRILEYMVSLIDEPTDYLN